MLNFEHSKDYNSYIRIYLQGQRYTCRCMQTIYQTLTLNGKFCRYYSHTHKVGVAPMDNLCRIFHAVLILYQ